MQLLTTVRIPPCHITVVAVQTGQGRKLLLLEPTPNSKSQALLEDAVLVETGPGGMVNIMLTNKEGHTVKVHQRALIATATVAKIVEPATILEGDQSTPVAPVRAVKNAKAARVEKLFALLPKEEAMHAASHKINSRSPTPALFNTTKPLHWRREKGARLTRSRCALTLEILPQRSSLHAACPSLFGRKWPASFSRCRRWE